MSKVLISPRQLEMLLKMQKPKYPIEFDYKVAPVVLNILKKYHPSELSK